MAHAGIAVTISRATLAERFRALVIGYGSIGQRHSRVLKELGCEVAVVTRGSCALRRYDDVEAGVSGWAPDYVVVANRTAEHYPAMQSLRGCGFRGRVLVEKPLFDKSQEPLLPERSFVRVAYNLRFHPLVAELRALMDAASEIHTVNVYVGSYLPDWRPGADYRSGYSARKAQGGGVLRDLSHEIDYVRWIFGPWRKLTALGGHFSRLDIDSEDAFSLLMTTERCPLVAIHMSYLDRVPSRYVSVTTSSNSVGIDLTRNTRTLDGVFEPVPVTVDHTYRAEHKAMLAQDPTTLCTVDEAMDTLVTIEAAEEAAVSFRWISR